MQKKIRTYGGKKYGLPLEISMKTMIKNINGASTFEMFLLDAYKVVKLKR